MYIYVLFVCVYLMYTLHLPTLTYIHTRVLLSVSWCILFVNDTLPLYCSLLWIKMIQNTYILVQCKIFEAFSISIQAYACIFSPPRYIHTNTNRIIIGLWSCFYIGVHVFGSICIGISYISVLFFIVCICLRLSVLIFKYV